MKRILIASAALILVAALTVTFAFAAAGIKVDGNYSNGEWLEKSSYKELISSRSESGNELSGAWTRCYIDADSRNVYYAFAGSIDKPSNETNPGIIIAFDSAGTVTLSEETGYSVSFGDGINTSGEAVMTFDDKNITCEACVNYKNGIPASVGGSVKFIDTTGHASNLQYFSFGNPDYYTTAVTQTDKQQKTTRSSGGKTPDTTRDSINVYDFITSARTTTKKQTTKKATTTAEPSSVKTTAEKTTAAKKSTTRKTSTRASTQKVETSVVYVIPDTVTATASQDTAPASVAESSSAQDSAFQIEKPSSGTLMKIITAVSAAVLFGVIGVVAVRSKNDDDRDEMSKESENKEE